MKEITWDDERMVRNLLPSPFKKSDIVGSLAAIFPKDSEDWPKMATALLKKWRASGRLVVVNRRYEFAPFSSRP